MTVDIQTETTGTTSNEEKMSIEKYLMKRNEMIVKIPISINTTDRKIEMIGIITNEMIEEEGIVHDLIVAIVHHHLQDITMRISIRTSRGIEKKKKGIISIIMYPNRQKFQKNSLMKMKEERKKYFRSQKLKCPHLPTPISSHSSLPLPNNQKETTNTTLKEMLGKEKGKLRKCLLKSKKKMYQK